MSNTWRRSHSRGENVLAQRNLKYPCGDKLRLQVHHKHFKCSNNCFFFPDLKQCESLASECSPGYAESFVEETHVCIFCKSQVEL